MRKKIVFWARLPRERVQKSSSLRSGREKVLFFNTFSTFHAYFHCFSSPLRCVRLRFRVNWLSRPEEARDEGVVDDASLRLRRENLPNVETPLLEYFSRVDPPSPSRPDLGPPFLSITPPVLIFFHRKQPFHESGFRFFDPGSPGKNTRKSERKVGNVIIEWSAYFKFLDINEEPYLRLSMDAWCP